MRQTDLTPRQKLVRLRRAALQALQRYDLEIRGVRLLLNEFNCLYRITAEDGLQYVLRLSAAAGCHDADETLAELMWLDALRRETPLLAPRPVPMRDGEFVGLLDRGLAPEHHQCVLFEWMPGRTLGGRCGPKLAGQLGELTATLHEHARSFELPAGRVRRYDRVFPYTDDTFDFREPVLIYDLRHRNLYTPELFAVYERARRRVQEVIDDLLSSGTTHLIHNDLHPWNVLVSDGRLAALDFEDLMWGVPTQDIATTFYYFRCREDGARLEKAYRCGYETRSPWPVTDPTQLDTLVAARGLILANTVLASPDPEVRSRASHWIPLIGERMKRWLG